MKKLFLKITNFGIKPGTPPDIAEQTKLVNGISFLGVPICINYILLFSITGFFVHTLAFLAGVVIFSFPLFLNKWFGVKVARTFISFMAPAFFCTASVLTGKDTGFYLGFLVISVPPIIIYPHLKNGIIYSVVSLLFLILSIAGNFFIAPYSPIPFAMGIFLFNLFTVFSTTIAVVAIFKSELNESRELLFEKNKEIIDSINYAKRIQYTLLAHDTMLTEHLPQHFVLFKPKDIVSGDFYWATSILSGQKKLFYLAVCDSTGHGVPGAFMSLLNISFLNEAITERKIYSPEQILNYARERLIESISKDGQQDGFDGLLLCIEPSDQINNEIKISYAAANNAPVLISGGTLTELACDKMPVGKGEKNQSFTLQNTQLKKGDSLYLYTDGYADQFGGQKGKKFKYKQLNKLILDNCQLSLADQKQLLEKSFEDWRGKLEQVDDVCIIGIKL